MWLETLQSADLKIDFKSLPDTLSRPEKEAIIYWKAKKQ